MRERMHELKTPEEVDSFIEKYPNGALFKAGGCHKTTQGFGFVEQALNGRETIHTGFVKVIEHRPASNHIAELTGIEHQSPQFILLLNGKPVFDVDNWEVTFEAVENALNTFHGPRTGTSCGSKSCGQFKPYIVMLEKFLAGELSADAFSSQWLSTFQMDATLRSTEQFNLLNSLFGDVDAALNGQGIQMATGHVCSGRAMEEETLRARAEDILKQLNVSV